MTSATTQIDLGREDGILPALRELYRAYDLLAPRFGKLLEGKPRPIITIQTAGRSQNMLGWLGPEFWEGPDEQHKNELCIVAERLGRGALAVLETLTHEMAHHANALDGVKDCNAAQYHNKKFKTVAESAGLTVEKMGRRGWAATRLGEDLRAFVADVIRLDEAAFQMFRNPGRKPTAPTKMKKWACTGCEKPMVVRCSRELNAECLDCGTLFVLERDDEEEDDAED